MKYSKVLLILSTLSIYFTSSLSQDEPAKTVDSPFTLAHTCSAESAEVVLTSKTPFSGKMYVENHSDKPACVQQVAGDTKNIKFTVDFKECLPDNHGDKSFVVIVQPNKRYVTKESFKQPIDCSNTADVQVIHVKYHLNLQNSIGSRDILKNADAATVSAKLLALSDAGAEVTQATIGDKIKLELKVDGDANKPFKDGMITLCELQDTKNPENKRMICDECLEDEEVIDEWRWDDANQKFVTALTVVTLPDVKDITISCTAKVCLDECPDPTCPKHNRRKRRQIYHKFPALAYSSKASVTY